MRIKFKGIDSYEMGVTVLMQPEIITPEVRTWTSFIDGKDGADIGFMGYKPYAFSFDIAVEGIENVDKVLNWLRGPGRFERSDFPDHYMNVHITEGFKLHRTVEWLYQGTVQVQVIDPFWYNEKDEWEKYYPNIMRYGWGQTNQAGGVGTHQKAPAEALEEGYNRNLLQGSDTYVKTKIYMMKSYPMDYSPKNGDTYTITLDATLGSGKSYFSIYNSGGYVNLATLNDTRLGEDGKYRASFTWKDTSGTHTANNTSIQIYQMYMGDESEESIIRSVKLEKGKESTKWTPAWSDLPDWKKPYRGWDNLVIAQDDLGEGRHRIRTLGGNMPLKTYISGSPHPKGSTSYLHVRNLKDTPVLVRSNNPRTSVVRLEGGESSYVELDNADSPTSNVQVRLEVPRVDMDIDIIATDPVVIETGGKVIENSGNYKSTPELKLVRPSLDNNKMVVKYNGSRIEYEFPNKEMEVIVRTATRDAMYKDEPRDRFMVMTGKFEVRPGPIALEVTGGDVYLRKEDRWI